MGLIYDGVRMAQRAGPPAPARQRREWSAPAKAIWWLLIFGVPIEMGGTARVIAFVVMGLIVASVLCVLVWALGQRKPAKRDPVAEYLDQAGQQKERR